MKDDELKDNEDEELEKGSDIDIVRERLQDEGAGLEALSQVIETTTDPRLKEILEAIQEDELKHNAALEAWLAENGQDDQESEESEATQQDEGEGESQPAAGSEDDEIPDLDKEAEDVGAGVGDKTDLIDDIRAILAEHEAEKAGDAGEAKDEDEDDTEDPMEKCRTQKSIRVPIIKGNEDQRIVYGVVSEPDTIDLQGDRLSKSEIRKACHRFMQTSQRIGKEHEGEAKADIIESYIAPVEFMCNGQVVKSGSWVMAVKVHDEGLWQDIKKGDITGFSIAGRGNRTPF